MKLKFTAEDYKNRIDKLRPVANELLTNNTPDDALDLVSKMDPVDAYILGRLIGSMVQCKADMDAFDKMVSVLMSNVNKPQGGTIHTGNAFQYN